MVSDSYCREFENAVAASLKPVYWYHNFVFKDECRLSFDIDFERGTNISFIVEKSETEKKARKSMHSDIKMYETSRYIDRDEKIKPAKFPKNGFWDEAYFSHDYGPMLLRKDRVFITMFCDKKELCPQLGEKLRRVSVLSKY